jgi:hypothetical protein
VINSLPPLPIAPQRFLAVTLASVALAEFDAILRAIFDRIKPRRMHRRQIVAFDPLELFDVEPPRGGAHLARVRIFAPASSPESSVMLTNLRDGWSSVAGLAAKKHRALQVVLRSTHVTAEYPLHELQLWQGGEEKRVVRVMRDSDRWEFYEQGVPFAFEDLALYLRRPTSVRLSREALVRYCNVLGWDLTKPESWEASGNAIGYDETRNVLDG